MGGRYEFLEHTADAAIRVTADTPAALFEYAALGMFDLITDIQTFREHPHNLALKKSFNFKAENRESLLILWMKELLFLFSSQKLVPVSFDFKMCENDQVVADIYFLTFNPARDVQKCEVKAVTYHQYEFKKIHDGWESTLIFDI